MAQETITAAVTQSVEICNAFTVAYVASHGGSIAGAFQGPLGARPLADASNVGFLYNATDQTPPLVYQCLPISAFGYAWYLVAAGADENDIRTVLGITPGVELSVTTPAALGVAAVGVGTTAARDDHVHQMPTAVQVGAIATSALSNAIPAAPGTASAGVSTNVSRADHVHTPTTAAQVGLGAVTATGADAATARTAIGLGTAATANTGTGPTNVIVGNDTRLTNARPPTAHASTHGTLGSDPIAPSDIGAIAASVMTTNGDIIAQIGGVPARVAATSDGYVLTLASGLPVWAATGGFADPLTTNGDIIARIAGVTTRLGKGSSLQVLRVNLAGTALEYAAATPMTSNGDLITYDSGQPKRLGLGSAGTVLSVAGGAPSWIAPTVTAAQISDATAAGRTLLTAVDASAQLTALGALATALLTTRGDIYVRNVSSVNRLPLGATNNVFSSDGTDAKWQSVATVMEGISSTRGSLLRRGASGWEALGAKTIDTFIGGDGTDITTRNASQVRTSLSINNVDNTSDVNKPVSTAQAAADALALQLTGGTMSGAIDMDGSKVINSIVPTAAGEMMVVPASVADGDTFIWSGGTLVRLPKGTDGDVYTLASGLPSWGSAGGGDTPLDVGAVLHHWRCIESSSPFTDTGSDPSSLALVVNNSRTYARAGLYRSFGATRGVASNSPSNAHMAATLTSIGVNESVTFGVTVASPTGSINPDIGGSGTDRVIARLCNTGGSYTGIWLTVVAGTTDLSARIFHAGGVSVTQLTVDWSRPHRIEVTVDATTKVSTFYVDGAVVWTDTTGSVTWPAVLDKVELGGASSGLGEPCRCTNLLCADLVADNTASTTADVFARGEAVRRLA